MVRDRGGRASSTVVRAAIRRQTGLFTWLDERDDRIHALRCAPSAPTAPTGSSSDGWLDVISAWIGVGRRRARTEVFVEGNVAVLISQSTASIHAIDGRLRARGRSARGGNLWRAPCSPVLGTVGSYDRAYRHHAPCVTGCVCADTTVRDRVRQGHGCRYDSCRCRPTVRHELTKIRPGRIAESGSSQAELDLTTRGLFRLDDVSLPLPSTDRGTVLSTNDRWFGQNAPPSASANHCGSSSTRSCQAATLHEGAAIGLDREYLRLASCSW